MIHKVAARVRHASLMKTTNQKLSYYAVSWSQGQFPDIHEPKNEKGKYLVEVYL